MLNQLDLYNFRCYDYKKIDFSKGINIILGENASGKSSIVEAIYIIGTCKSFRTYNDRDIIKFNKDFYSVIANTDEGLISVMYSKGEKRVSLNEQNIKSLSKYIGIINTVLFSPEDLKLIKGDPKNRRRFLDVCISQNDKEYLETLIEYNKILKERNELLKQLDYNGTNLDKNNEIMLDIYSETLINKAKVLIIKRREFLIELQKIVSEKMRLMNKSEEVKVIYTPNVSENELSEEFKRKKQQDLFTQTTNFGPHRDDFDIYVNEKRADSFASQGQQRTITLALKIAYASLLQQKNKKVIMILDDVYGELDEKRQKDLIKMLDLNTQIIITTTTLNSVDEEILNKSKVIKL